MSMLRAVLPRAGKPGACDCEQPRRPGPWSAGPPHAQNSPEPIFAERIETKGFFIFALLFAEPIFAKGLGYLGLWDCSPILHRHTNVDHLDSGIAHPIPSHPNASKGQGGTRMDQPNRAQSSVLLGAPAESRLMCTCIPPYGRVSLTAVPVLRYPCCHRCIVHRCIQPT